MSFLTKILPAAAAFLMSATPALADAITLDAGDIGVPQTISFNGFADGTTINGLTAEGVFTLTSITNGGSTWNFTYSIDNTSSSPITASRVSGFAFDTTPGVVSASSTGLFSFSDISGNYPNGIQTVDVCFKTASTGASCAGGAGGGVAISDPAATGTFTLNFASPITSLTFDDFYVRYQSIVGPDGTPGSATGIGSSTTTTSTSTGGQVPEPGVVGLMGAAAAAVMLLRRRRRPARSRSMLLPEYA